ncbi:MarR family winged helix-turn-helix transcriptional regulator [Modestobacter altitudinis]|uniref:MarR family winged helix-turn-helix transcriptional regulator n=1 Tax=Modestobacter altitudinis TaxID=2213158 RepID=UPI0014864ECB|nr:MarR family transcriptional regulator [Modestobacter altitudinis]
MIGTQPGGAVPEDVILVQAARTFVSVSVQAADQLGSVSLVQLRALSVIDEADGANLMRLTDGMGVTVSTASRLVDRLVAAGLVDRRQSEVTRREITLTLTAQGRSLLARYDELRLSALHRRLDELPSRRRAALISALSDLVAARPGPQDP